MNHPKITLALTHFERFEMLLESFAHVKGDERIDKIMVVDDASSEETTIKLLDFENSGDAENFVCEFNHENLDCYRNKKRAVSLTETDWLILLDSDNIIRPDYLDTIYALPEWDPKTVYCPEFARPHFDYREFSDCVFDRSIVAQYMDNDKFQCCLNTANYFINRAEYLRVWDGSVNPHTSDSIFQMYNWFAGGNRMHVVPGLQYDHRVHGGSHYKKNHSKTGKFEREVVERLKGLR